MSETALIGLPLMEAAQSQKHVTHNEALLLIDGVLQLAVSSRALAEPPESPAEGARYLVSSAAAGAWAGHAGDIAIYAALAWRFLTPREGWRMWVSDEASFLIFDGTSWSDLRDIDALNGLSALGVNATADSWNRLIVSAPGVLFTHESGDHRMTLNKEAAGNTGSLLFQTGYSGRAELGLAGDDDFHFKVSADGATWFEALAIDRGTGVVRFPSGASLAVDHAAAALANDVQLAVSGQFEDGPLLALEAGTWLVSFHASYESAAAAAATVTARISDGSAAQASQSASHAAVAGAAVGLSMTAIVSLAAATTLKGQMASSASAASGAMTAATMMTAIRIG
jgi:hypothetical protein